MNKEMTEDDYIAWREANEWFFDILKERQDEYTETANSLLSNFSATPFSFTDIQKQTIIAVTHRGAMIQDILDMTYEDIGGEDDAS